MTTRQRKSQQRLQHQHQAQHRQLAIDRSDNALPNRVGHTRAHGQERAHDITRQLQHHCHRQKGRAYYAIN
eukprot:11136927-Alexandrium_andersonii.AAC.1